MTVWHKDVLIVSLFSQLHYYLKGGKNIGCFKVAVICRDSTNVYRKLFKTLEAYFPSLL